MKRYRVLFISHEYETIYGATRSMCNMIHSMGNAICPTILLPGKGKAYDYIKEQGIDCIILPIKCNCYRGEYNMSFYINSLPRLIRNFISNYYSIFRLYKEYKGKFDIIHSNSSIIDIGPKVAKIMGVKHVWHLREFLNLDHGYNPILGWRYLRKKIKKSDVTISISKSISSHFRLNESPQNHVLYNAISSRDSYMIINEQIREKFFLFCGSVVPSKGIEDAIVAFASFRQLYPEYKLVIVGGYNEEYRSQLDGLLIQLNIREFVIWEGYKQNVKDYMLRAKALLMCSRMEAMGRVTAEAMLSRCPVIGYNSAGTKELLCDCRGFLYETHDELVQMLETVINNDIDDVIENAYSYALLTFTEENYKEKIIKIYSTIFN